MHNNILVIVNKNSGTSDPTILHNLYKKLTENKVNYEIKITKCLDDLDHIMINTIHKYDGVVVVGGDGTVFHLLQRLKTISSGVPIGVIPCGSGNGLVNSLLYHKNKTIFNNNIDDVIDDILRFNTTKLDLIEVRSDNNIIYSFLFLSYGLFTNIDIGTDWLRWMGTVRFTIGAIFQLLMKSSIYGELEYKNGENDWITERGMFIHFMANNLSHTSNDSITSPHSKVDDGLIYITYIKEPCSRWRLLKVLLGLSDGSFIDHVTYVPTTEFKFKTNAVLDIDGEPMDFSFKEIHCKSIKEGISLYN